LHYLIRRSAVAENRVYLRLYEAPRVAVGKPHPVDRAQDIIKPQAGHGLPRGGKDIVPAGLHADLHAGFDDELVGKPGGVPLHILHIVDQIAKEI